MGHDTEENTGASPAEDGAPPPGSLTRGQVAARLGVSRWTVTRWANDGRLRVCAVVDGARYYSARSVEALRKGVAASAEVKNDGDLAVRLFTAFQEGKDLPTIVCEMQVAPQVVRDHFREYSTSLEDGERRRRQRDRDAREEREAREMAEINRQYDREAARASRDTDQALRAGAVAMPAMPPLPEVPKLPPLPSIPGLRGSRGARQDP